MNRIISQLRMRVVLHCAQDSQTLAWTRTFAS
jgi:hypothetical protein